ncbi:MAG: hypothetical protein R6T92_07625 [Desulfosalsimonadaceae bacterium]
MAKINLSQLNDVLEKQIGTVFHVGMGVHKKSFSDGFVKYSRSRRVQFLKN